MTEVGSTGHLRIVSYNTHGCVGTDGLFAPRRIVEVLDELAPDIIGLQEVDTRRGKRHGIDVLELIARGTGMSLVFGPTLGSGEGRYGNALVTRLPVRSVEHHDVSVSGRERRGVIDARLELRPGILRVIITHLGLLRGERRKQVELIRELVDVDDEPDVTILLGDMNEWQPFSRQLRPLDGVFGPCPRPRSFPSRWPMLRLDRVWVQPRGHLVEVKASRTPITRVASDHLPVLAIVSP